LPFLHFWQILLFANNVHVTPFGGFCFCLSRQQKNRAFLLFAYFAFFPNPAN